MKWLRDVLMAIPGAIERAGIAIDALNDSANGGRSGVLYNGGSKRSCQADSPLGVEDSDLPVPVNVRSCDGAVEETR